MTDYTLPGADCPDKPTGRFRSTDIVLGFDGDRASTDVSATLKHSESGNSVDIPDEDIHLGMDYIRISNAEQYEIYGEGSYWLSINTDRNHATKANGARPQSARFWGQLRRFVQTPTPWAIISIVGGTHVVTQSSGLLSMFGAAMLAAASITLLHYSLSDIDSD